jgi:secreted PhoX family phosphatase
MKDDDIVSNNSNNQTFQEVVEARLSRRGFFGGGLATAAAVSLAARGRSSIFTKRTESVRSGDLGPQIVSDRVLGSE